MSLLLFAISADAWLCRLARVVSGDEVVWAFADDISMVVSNYLVTLPTVQVLFSEYAKILALKLNIDKTILIPLWPYVGSSNIQRLGREHCASWSQIAIERCWKYLGF